PSDQPAVGIAYRLVPPDRLQSDDAADNHPDRYGEHQNDTDADHDQEQGDEPPEKCEPEGPDRPAIVRLDPGLGLAAIKMGKNDADNGRDADDEADEIEHVDELDIGFARFEPSFHLPARLSFIRHCLSPLCVFPAA